MLAKRVHPHDHPLHVHQAAALPEGASACEHCGQIHAFNCPRIRLAEFEWHEDQDGHWQKFITRVAYDAAISAELWHSVYAIANPEDQRGDEAAH